MRSSSMASLSATHGRPLLWLLCAVLGLILPSTSMAQASVCASSTIYFDTCEPDCVEIPSAGSGIQFDPAANDHNEVGMPIVVDGASLTRPELSLQNGLVGYTPASPPGALPYVFAYRTERGGVGSAEIRLAGPTTGCDAENPGQPPAPPAPTGLAATITATPSIRLTWNASAGPPSVYRLHRAVGSGSSNFVAFPDLPGTATSFEDFGVVRNTTYRYRIQSIAGDGTPSALSTPVDVSVYSGVTVTYGSANGPAVTNGYQVGSPQIIPIGYGWTSCTPTTNAYCEFRLFVHNPTTQLLTISNATDPNIAGPEVYSNIWPFQLTQSLTQVLPSNHGEFVVRLNALRSDENNAWTWVRMRFNNAALPDFVFKLQVNRDVGRPVIDVQPDAKTVIAGTPVTFTATAHHSGGQQMAYVWFQNTQYPPGSPDGVGNLLPPPPHPCLSGQRRIGTGTSTLTVQTTPECMTFHTHPYNDYFVQVATACGSGPEQCTPEFGRNDGVHSRRAALEIINLTFTTLPAAITHVPNQRSVQLTAGASATPARPLSYVWSILDAGGQTHDCVVEATYCNQWGLTGVTTPTVSVNLTGTPNAAFAGTLKLRVRAEISPGLAVTTDPVAQPIAIQFYGSDSLPSFADSFYRGAAFKREDRALLHGLQIDVAPTATSWATAPNVALRIDQSLDAIELGDMPAGTDWRQYRHAEIPFVPGNNPQIAKSSVEYYDAAVWQAQAWFRSATTVGATNVDAADELVARVEANNGTNGNRRIILVQKRSATNWLAYADVPFTVSANATPLTLEYDAYSNRANVWFNGVMVIANIEVPTRPNIQFAGFSLRARNSATADSPAARGYAAGNRNAQPPAMVPMFFSDFDLATFADWSAKVDPGLTPLISQLASPNRVRVTATPTNNVWLADRTPVSAHRYIGEFEFDPSALTTMNAADVPVLFTLNDNAGGNYLQLQMRGGNTSNLIDLRLRAGPSGALLPSNWIRDLAKSKQRVRIELVSPEPGVPSGNIQATLTVTPLPSGVARAESVITTGSSLAIEEARLGIVAGTRETMAGSILYDAFRSYRPRR